MRVKGIRFSSETIISYSDDQGKTWHETEPLRKPLQWVVPHGRFLELEDGTVCLTVYGTLTEEDADAYAGCNGIFRSRDGGQTWGDFSLVFRHGPKRPEDPHPEPRYTELDLQVMPDDRWVALSRTENGSQGPRGIGGGTSVGFSTDQGYTWTKPVQQLMGGGQQFTLLLPHGGLAIATRSHSW